MSLTSELRMNIQLGQIVATPGAIEALAESKQRADVFLRKHLVGDWGVVDKSDARANNRALKNDERLLSAYVMNNGAKLWIITEWDRSVTTLLLPEEY